MRPPAAKDDSLGKSSKYVATLAAAAAVPILSIIALLLWLPKP